VQIARITDDTRLSFDALYSLAVLIDAPLRPALKSILVDGKTLLTHLKTSDKEAIARVSLEVSKRLSEVLDKASSSIADQREVSRRMTRAG